MREDGWVVRVVIGEGDPLAGAYLQQLLGGEADIRVVGVARSDEELLAMCEREQPQVVVSEVGFGGVSWTAALGQLGGRGSGLSVLVLSADQSSDSVLSAVGAGVAGYVLKDRAFTDLAEAVRKVALGEVVLDDRLVPVLLAGYRELASGVGLRSLTGGTAAVTGRALEVLEWMAEGLRNRAIAERMGLSEHTIKVYVSQVLAQLGAPDRTAAVMTAIRRGIVRAPRRAGA